MSGFLRRFVWVCLVGASAVYLIMLYDVDKSAFWGGFVLYMVSDIIYNLWVQRRDRRGSTTKNDPGV